MDKDITISTRYYRIYFYFVVTNIIIKNLCLKSDKDFYAWKSAKIVPQVLQLGLMTSGEYPGAANLREVVSVVLFDESTSIIYHAKGRDCRSQITIHTEYPPHTSRLTYLISSS